MNNLQSWGISYNPKEYEASIENFAPTASPVSTDCEETCCNTHSDQISDLIQCYAAALSQINGSENIKGELGPPCCTGGDST